MPNDLKTKCPICKQDEMKKHCDNSSCRWARCLNATCEAALDFAKGIGHHFALDGERDPENRKMVRRFRVQRVAGEWVRRDA